MAYLDHNATSPLRPEAKAAMEAALAIGGNPSSVHAAGRAARAAVETARDQVAALVCARPQDVVFTSGGTEANALAIFGAVQGAAEQGKRITRIFVSVIEHESVLANAIAVSERVPGIRLELIPVTSDGVIDLEALRVLLREGKGRALVAVMAANNETGAIQPLAAVGKRMAEHEGYLLVDAVQTAGKLPLDAPGPHYVTLSAHKLGGPQGVGALIVQEGVPFAAMIQGGGQERGLRAGTENVAAIAGFGAAAAVAQPIPRVLRDRFEAELKALAPNTIIFSEPAPRLNNTSNFALPGIPAETSLISLDLDGVMVSSGAACSSGKVQQSHVLKAMGVADDIAECALRVSFGWNSTEDDVDVALAAIDKLVARHVREAA